MFLRFIDNLDLLTFSVFSILLWCLIGLACFIFFSMFVPTFQNYKTMAHKVEFVSYSTGIIHAIVATYLSWYGIFYTCTNSEHPLTTD